MVERFIRTLKTRIERYFTETNSVRWVDVLQNISDGINNSVNRSIGMAPNEVTYENRRKVFQKLYGKIAMPLECKFNIGDKVRIPLKKNIFDKGYKVTWTKDIYTVTKQKNDGSVCFYNVESPEGETLEKFFYDQELNLVVKNG